MKGAVLHVVVAGEIGGAERMLVDLAQSPDRVHSIALMTPSDRLRSLFADNGLSVDDRGAVRENPIAYLARSLGARDVAWIADVAQKRRASILHLHTFASQVVGTRAAKRVSARVVRTEHSTRVYDDPTCWPFSRWSLQRADAAVCISEHVRRVAVAKAPWAEGVLRVVPNGVDTTRFTRAPFPAIEDGRVRFVMVGRLEPRKGVDTAIEAIRDVPRAALEIVGDGEERGPLEALAARLGIASRVHFSGFTNDVRGAIARSHVALSSSRSEGLGIALIEAMAMGRAVVALPTGGVPELVVDGETGWLARDSLARAIEDAIASPTELEARGERARKRITQLYSLEAMRRGYEAVYAAIDR